MDAMSRRQFLARFGGTALTAAAVSTLPELLRWKGWYDPAVAQEADVVLDTFNGLAAMVWPGDDAYSQAQGEATDRPGAIAANAGHHIREALDFFVPWPDGPGMSNDRTMPMSGGIASTINVVAATVDPIGTPAPFPSHFARLSFGSKVETWRRLEEETRNIDSSGMPEPYTHSAGVLQFVFGVLPGFVQFFGFAEVDVWDTQSRTVSQRPVGWEHSGYLREFGTQPPEGNADFQGYYRGRRVAEGGR